MGPAGGAVLETGTGLAARYAGAKRVAGSYLSPGLVCAHTHLYSALARGLMVDIAPSKDFAQQLKHLWWRLDRAIDLPILEASALAGCADAARSGVTSVVDHHAGPEAIDGSLTVIRKAFEEVGLRGLLCYETTDRNGMDGARAGISENLRFVREIDADREASEKGEQDVAGSRRPLVDAAIGAHAGFTIGEETLAALGDAVRSSKRGLHIHAGEDKFDAVDSRYRFGVDLAPRLDAAGCLGPKTIIGHGVWLGEAEADLLNARGSFLAHNARSNMNNAVGYNALLPRFVNVVLGTDGMSADMLEEFRFACFRHREAGGPWWPAEFLRCLDRGNRLMERYMGLPGPSAASSPARPRTSCCGTTIRRRPWSAATSPGTSLSASPPGRSSQSWSTAPSSSRTASRRSMPRASRPRPGSRHGGFGKEWKKEERKWKFYRRRGSTATTRQRTFRR